MMTVIGGESMKTYLTVLTRLLSTRGAFEKFVEWYWRTV